MERGFREQVLSALATVGPGQVVSYGDLAAEGIPVAEGRVRGRVRGRVAAS